MKQHWAQLFTLVMGEVGSVTAELPNGASPRVAVALAVSISDVKYTDGSRKSVLREPRG